MFVTSDIFDLKRIGRFRDFDWRENLLCGVAVHGSQWAGYQADAQFLLAAAKRCRVLEEMKYAGYSRVRSDRSRSIKPKSFERLARGELSGAREATRVLLRGELTASGSQRGDVLVGGESGSIRQRRSLTGPRPIAGPPWPFHADFIFPLNERPIETARDLFRMSIDILGAEYGYFFVRDDLCFPSAYPYGISPPLDWGALSNEEAEEIGRWADFVKEEGGLWLGKWPMFRDLYEMNLISERHTSVPVDGLGYLAEWISSEAERGRLEDMGRGRLLWILTDAEMFNVRPLLNQAGLLLSCRNRVYRDLPQASASP